MSGWSVAAATCAPTTLVGSGGAADRSCVRSSGPVPLSRWDRRTLERHDARLVAEGGVNGKPLSPSSVKLAHAVVRPALRCAPLDAHPAQQCWDALVRELQPDAGIEHDYAFHTCMMPVASCVTGPCT